MCVTLWHICLHLFTRISVEIVFDSVMIVTTMKYTSTGKITKALNFFIKKMLYLAGIRCETAVFCTNPIPIPDRFRPTTDCSLKMKYEQMNPAITTAMTTTWWQKKDTRWLSSKSVFARIAQQNNNHFTFLSVLLQKTLWNHLLDKLNTTLTDPKIELSIL